MRALTGIGVLVFALGGCGTPEVIGSNNNNVLAAHCYDNRVSDDEVDVDCGGKDCLKCDEGLACADNGDCKKGVCTKKVCGPAPACNAPCNYANGVGACENGKCVLASCNAGFGDCDQQAANGCEVDLDSDPANCGACANRCNSFLCARGVCGGGQGGCGPCNPANGVGKCNGNVCMIDSCNQGFADCNGDVKDGCEVNLTNNASNCGACGKMCLGIACNNGVCGGGGGGCNAFGFADCNRDPKDGCETNTMTDPVNCGACGKACGFALKCVVGACK